MGKQSYYRVLRHEKTYLVVWQFNKNLTYTTSLNISEVWELVLLWSNIWSEVDSDLFEKVKIEPIKTERKYRHGELKTWKELIKVNFHSQDVLYKICIHATGVLKIYSAHKQSICWVSIQSYMLMNVKTLMQKANNVAWLLIKMMMMIMICWGQKGDITRCREKSFVKTSWGFQKNKWRCCGSCYEKQKNQLYILMSK